MTATATAVRSAISLKGSAQLVQDFFYFGLNSILYQRGVYPAESFIREKKYGLPLFVTSNPKLHDFLTPLLKQIQYCLVKKKLKRLVIAICSVQTKEVLERWQFDIETDHDITENDENSGRYVDESKIKRDMANVLRQISASVSFLPALDELCSFDVLIYTGKDADMPKEWTESDARDVIDGQELLLRSFSTSVHSVHAKVTYKLED